MKGLKLVKEITREPPKEIVKNLLDEIYFLEEKLDKAYRKNRAQRQEIKRLNKAIIERNYHLNTYKAKKDKCQ